MFYMYNTYYDPWHKSQYSKTCLKRPLLNRPKFVFKTKFRLMQVKSIAEHSAIFSTCIKLPFVIKIFVLSIFEWKLKTCFIVRLALMKKNRVQLA